MRNCYAFYTSIDQGYIDSEAWYGGKDKERLEKRKFKYIGLEIGRGSIIPSSV